VESALNKYTLCSHDERIDGEGEWMATALIYASSLKLGC